MSAEDRWGIGGVFDLTNDERDRQDSKWGEQNHPFFSVYGVQREVIAFNTPNYLLLEREYKKRNDRAVRNGRVGWDTILLEEVFEALAKAGVDDDEYEKELIEVMAVASAMIEANRRRRRGEVG